MTPRQHTADGTKHGIQAVRIPTLRQEPWWAGAGAGNREPGAGRRKAEPEGGRQSRKAEARRESETGPKPEAGGGAGRWISERSHRDQGGLGAAPCKRESGSGNPSAATRNGEAGNREVLTSAGSVRRWSWRSGAGAICRSEDQADRPGDRAQEPCPQGEGQGLARRTHGSWNRRSARGLGAGARRGVWSEGRSARVGSGG